MTTHHQGGELIPEWTLGDRLRKARMMTGMTVAEFAERIGVSDRTINNAEGDRRTVRKITLNAWALATGVSARWLATGEGQPTTTPPNGGQPTTPDDALRRLASRKRARHAGEDTSPRYLAAMRLRLLGRSPIAA